MRQTVSEANKYLRQTVKSVEAGGVATLAQAMEHPGTLQEVHVTTLDAADAEIPAAAGLSEGVKLPTRIETKKLVIVGKFPIATQEEYDALSDAMKDKAVLLTVDECPIGSEVKAIECNALGVPVDAHMWVMGLNGWKGGSASALLPDGTIAMSGPVVAPNLRMPLGPQRLSARGLRIGCWGSSTLAVPDTPDVLAGATTSHNQGTVSIFHAINSTLGSDFELMWNGAVSGTVTSQVDAKMATDWPTVAGYIDIAWIQGGANDIPAGTQLSTFGPYVRKMVLRAINAGKLVCLHVPHARDTEGSVVKAIRRDYQAFCYALKTELSQFPGQIEVFDSFEQLVGEDGLTPAEYLQDGTHLNGEGALQTAPAAMPLIRSWSGQLFASDPRAYGPVLYELDLSTLGTTYQAGNCTVTADVDTEDGRKQWLVTASIALASVFSPAGAAVATMDASKIYRLFVDYDIVSMPNPAPSYVDGARLSSTGGQAHRTGIYSNNGGNAPYSQRRLGRVRTLGTRFQPSGTAHVLALYPGGADWTIRMRTCAIIEAQ